MLEAGKILSDFFANTEGVVVFNIFIKMLLINRKHAYIKIKGASL